MPEWDRNRAVDRIERLVETVETDRMPVPVTEIWVYGEVALGLDPVGRLDVYLTKDILLGKDQETADRSADTHSVEGIGQTVRADWADSHPEYVRTNAGGYAAPERCLAAHLLEDDEPIHLEVCNASFEDNVTQRVRGALARESYEEILDPRGVCLWLNGRRAPDSFEKLRNGEYVFPTLPNALEMLGLESKQAQQAASTIEEFRQSRSGSSVRGDVV